MQLAARPLIAHIIDRLPPDGAERLLVDLMRYRDDRFRYVVLCLVEGGALEVELAELEVPVHLFGKSRRYDLLCLWRLIRWLRAERPLAVHTHLFTADTWGRLAAWIARVPGIFSTIHSANDWKSKTDRLIDRLLARITSRIVACSSAVEQTLVSRDRIVRKRIICIPNGVDLARLGAPQPAPLAADFGFPENVPVLAVIGRLHPAKGHLDLIPVLSMMVKEGIEFRGLFIGEGPLRSEIEAALEAHELSSLVVLTGQRNDVPSLLAAVDLVVMPSRWEGLPIALLEAMACERAILATTVGGIPDVIRDGREGLLVPPGETEHMAHALRRLLRSEPLRSELGLGAGRLLRSQYDASVTMQAYEALYDQIRAAA